MSIANSKRRVFGIKIPDIFLRNDDDDVTTGQLTISKAGTVALAMSGSDADIQFTGTNSQLIMSGHASGIRLTGTGAKFYIANDGGQVGTFAFEGSSVRMYFGGGTGTFV